MDRRWRAQIDLRRRSLQRCLLSAGHDVGSLTCRLQNERLLINFVEHRYTAIHRNSDK